MILLYFFKKIFKRKAPLHKKNNWEAAYLIGPGEANCKLGPGDHTGVSYAFDIYDFANGTYKYEIFI